MKTCPACQTPNEDSAVFCDNCGANLAGAPGGGMPPMQPAYTPPAQPAGFPPQPGGGVQCPQCGTQNMAGTMFCDNCGASLQGVAAAPGGMPPAAPVYPPPGQPAGFPPPVPPAPGFQQPPAAPGFPPQQPGYPPPGAGVGAPPPFPARLMIGGQQVMVPQKAEAVIGRADIASGWNPEVALTPFGGTPEAGVSRKHAKLVWQGASWAIEDLNSVNGTYVRGARIVPNQRTPINAGDALQLGKLQLTFYPQ